MSLISHSYFNGLISLITCDTRQTINYEGREMIFQIEENKIEQLSGNIVLVASGAYWVTTEIIQALKAHKVVYIDDVYKALKLIDKKLKREITRNKYDEYACINVMGITRSNKLREISYTIYTDGLKSELIYRKKKEGLYDAVASYPDEQVYLEAMTTVGKLQLNNRDSYCEITKQLVSYFGDIQKKYYELQPMLVSEILYYHAFFKNKDTGKFEQMSGRINLTENEVL